MKSVTISFTSHVLSVGKFQLAIFLEKGAIALIYSPKVRPSNYFFEFFHIVLSKYDGVRCSPVFCTIFLLSLPS